jgi:hypothetical protein
MSFERFDGIGGTTRIITARRGKQMTERHLIPPYQQDEDQFHELSPA